MARRRVHPRLRASDTPLLPLAPLTPPELSQLHALIQARLSLLQLEVQRRTPEAFHCAGLTVTSGARPSFQSYIRFSTYEALRDPGPQLRCTTFSLTLTPLPENRIEVRADLTREGGRTLLAEKLSVTPPAEYQRVKASCLAVLANWDVDSFAEAIVKRLQAPVRRRRAVAGETP